MKASLSEMRKNYDQLNINIGKQLSLMKAAVQRWDFYYDSINEVNTWLNDTQDTLTDMPDSKGQLGEMKTNIQRYKYIEEEINKRQESMKTFEKEAVELSKLSGDKK